MVTYMWSFILKLSLVISILHFIGMAKYFTFNVISNVVEYKQQFANSFSIILCSLLCHQISYAYVLIDLWLF